MTRERRGLVSPDWLLDSCPLPTAADHRPDPRRIPGLAVCAVTTTMGRVSAHPPSERTAASEANSASLFGGLDPNLVEIFNTAGECGIA